MSEEQPPPSLRLKPRLRPADAAAPATEPAVTGATDSKPELVPAETQAPKIQLKPRIEPNIPPAENAISQGAAPAPSAPPEPPVFASTPPPAVVPPLFAPSAPPAADAPVLFSDSSSAAGSTDAGKLKLKPKAPPPVATSSGTVPPIAVPVAAPAVPVNVAPPTTSQGSRAPMPPPPAPGTMPPPFPVVAQVKTGRSNPPMPVPHVSVKTSVLEVQPDAQPPAETPKKRVGQIALLGGLALVVLGAGGFFAWNKFMAKSPPPVAQQKAAPAKPAPSPSSTPPAPAAAANTSPTPSETLNKLAHAPANAINKAQEALSARRASGQARVDAAADGIDVPDKPFGPPPAAPIKPATPTKATATTTVAPGLFATTQVEAGAEASAAFRSFVANAKVSGVFQGTPARAYVNGRLLRAGETADAGLGIIFDGIDGEHHQLVFKDHAGATVSRKY